MKKSTLARSAFGALGALALIGTATAAIADEVSNDEVDITVQIEELAPTGALTLSVADDATTLSEVTSTDPTLRQFDGALPTVTVTDTRSSAPAGVFWYVVGQSSAFTATGADPIGPENLGWTPRLLTAADNGEVAEGEQVDTVHDAGPNAVGLAGEELLYLTLDSADAHPVGTWDASADLFLKTPVDVAPGNYQATLTLTLWEDAY